MATIILRRWRYRDPITGRQVVTRYRATDEEMLARHPDAKPVPWTEEVREIGEPSNLSASHVAKGNTV